MSDGCTAGAKIIGNRYYLLKNRDLIWGGFRDSVVIDKEVFFVTGVNVSDGKQCGASFGFNRFGLSGCNTTVLVTSHMPYDPLLERILRETKTIDEAFELVRDDLKSGNLYQWCNFVLASPDGVGVIEIGDGEAVLETDPRMITRTNHHLILPTADILRNASVSEREAGGPLITSQSRRQEAAKLLAEASSYMDMTQILSTHREGRGFDSICRHRSLTPRSNPYLGETVYSYIAEVTSKDSEAFEFRIKVAAGNPCANTYDEFILDFDSPESKYHILTRFP
ncbi:MAG: hypothetical protein ACFFDQ_12390 [Candidatus Thorarchaeota archaeon]